MTTWRKLLYGRTGNPCNLKYSRNHEAHNFMTLFELLLLGFYDIILYAALFSEHFIHFPRKQKKKTCSKLPENQKAQFPPVPGQVL